MGKVDLHMHSTVSDGKYTPAEVVDLAVENGLDTIALTDHDSYDGYLPACKKAKEYPGTVIIPGAEITCKFNEQEIHMLAYGFDVDAACMIDLVTNHREARIKRAAAIIEQLTSLGFDVTIDEVKAETTSSTNNGSPNIARPHIANVLVEKGYVASINEAFIRYLNDDELRDIKTDYRTVEDVINCVKKAGGATVLAHPGYSYNESELMELVDMGMDGIECLHPSHNYRLQKYYEELCSNYQLLATGGSDFHGYGKDHQNLGIIAVGDKIRQRMYKLIGKQKTLHK